MVEPENDGPDTSSQRYKLQLDELIDPNHPRVSSNNKDDARYVAPLSLSPFLTLSMHGQVGPHSFPVD